MSEHTHETQTSEQPTLAAPATEPQEAPEGERTLGPYRLTRRLGSGGMGEVWEAEQEEPLRRRVAIKLVKLGMDTQRIVERFEGERQTLAMMSHANIARVYDAGTTPRGRPFFAMELVEGVPLHRYCDQHRLSTRDRIGLFLQVCNGVQHAHQKGIIHRDLKPSNLLVCTTDEGPIVKIIDFGVAKALNPEQRDGAQLTQLGHWIGTPAYMSPEQADPEAEDIDIRTDIYALGVVLYELLTDTHPLASDSTVRPTANEIRDRIRHQDPPPPSTRVGRTVGGSTSNGIATRRGTDPASLARKLRGDLDWITLKCLEKDRERRYPSTSALAEDLQRHLDSRPVQARPPSAPYRARKFIRRHRLAMTAGAVVAAALLLGLVGTSVGFVRARAAQRLAEEERAAAEAVNRFLNEDLLAAADPFATGERDVSMQQVLRNASRTLESRFPDQPLIKARIDETLGATFRSLGLYREAEIHLQRAVESFALHLGPRHRSTLAAQRDLGTLYEYMGRFEDAEELLDETAAAQTARLGANHPDTLETLAAVVLLYTENGRPDEAEKLAEELVPRMQAALGSDHETTLGTMDVLAVSYMDRGRLEESRQLLEEVRRGGERLWGPDHPLRFQALTNLGWVVYLQGDLETARDLTSASLEGKRRVLGDEHPETLTAVNNLGVIYRRMARNDLAEPLYREALEVGARTMGEDHPETIISEVNLARFYQTEGRCDQAMPLLDHAIGVQRRVQPSNYYGLGVALQTLGDCQVELGRKAAAHRSYEEAEPILSHHLPPSHEGLQRLHEAMAQLATGGR